ncbi:MAG TPA: hypothetical protein VG123_14835 [Streptosporangiaceae bacterium]|nr:hypothetical protein [Streptosporangiaceae bacterium]
MDGFLLTYDGFDPGSEGLREALTSTGNGYLCTRSAAEWEEAAGSHSPRTHRVHARTRYQPASRHKSAAQSHEPAITSRSACQC